MKKSILSFVAVAAFAVAMVACSKPAENQAETTDSTAVETTTPAVDSTAADTTATVADTTAQN